MSYVRVLRSGLVGLALASLGSAVALDAMAQANDNGPARSPSASQPQGSPGSGRPQSGGSPSGNSTSGMGSQSGTGQSGYNTGQQDADPHSSSSAGQGGASNAPNCSQAPPNAAECPQGSGSR
jgi:hypothetical protein